MNEQPPPSFWNRLSNTALIRFLLFFAVGWALTQLLAYFETVIVIFAFATILAFLLNFPVRWLERYMPRSVAAAIIFVLSLVMLGALTATVGLSLVSQAQQLLDSLILFLNSLVPLVSRLEEILRNRNIQVDLDALEQQLQNQLVSILSNGITYSFSTIQIFFANFINLILIAVVAFFMLLDGYRLWELILKLVPQQFRHRFAVVVKRKFLGFVRGQLILTAFLTTTTFIVFIILKVPFTLILSLIIGLFDVIPGIGATLGVSLVSLIVLSQGFWLALKVFVACVVLQQIQDNLISPRVMQGSLNVNPVVIFFALLVGARVAGLVGLFLAIPITGVIVSLFEIDEMKAES